MTKPADDTTQVDLTQALRIWAKRKNIRPIDFSYAMGWGYSHSWAVLKGKGTFSPEAYGKFFMVYGLPAIEEVLRIAKVDPKGTVENVPS